MEAVRIPQRLREHGMNGVRVGVEQRPWDVGELGKGLCAAEGGG